MTEPEAPTPPPSWRAEPAGFASRTVAFVIDAVVISVAASVTLFSISAVSDVLDPGVRHDPTGGDLGFLTFSVVLASTAFVYFTCGFWLFGRTVGKLAMGLRVVQADGTRPGLVRSMLRTFGYLLSTFLFLGFLAVAVSRQRRAWHDHLGRTWVVYDWDAHPRLAASEDIAPLPPRRLP